MIKETKEKRTVTQEVTVKIEMSCDICGKVVNDDKNWVTPDNYNEFIETTVMIDAGYRYNDGYDHTSRSYDVCPDCFNSVLIPIFTKNGAIPTIKEYF